jgi:CheY-like chemotaxis protein
MEAIGRLAGGVAHDMNNMLAAIMSFASAIQEDIDPGSHLQQDLRDILKACQRGRALTQNLLGVARKGTYRRERFSLNDAVDELAELLKRTISKRIEVRKVQYANLPEIEGDPNQIQQALINLSLNAADAMEGEGTLTFTTKLVDLDVDVLKSTPDLTAGVYVELQISDTGAGMDAETLQHAFEPFFTTKPTGEGTGLGLSMVYGTIKNHRGRVFIDSQPDEGTTVTIQLPGLLSLPTSREARPQEARTRAARGAGTVLLVDDEELVRKSGKRLLEQLGYRVFLAENGTEALDLYRQLKDQIDFVLLDLIMPVMDGHELYLKLKELEPSVKVIFCSGFTQDEGASSLIAAPDTRFIRKPFDVEQLASELAKCSPKR